MHNFKNVPLKSLCKCKAFLNKTSHNQLEFYRFIAKDKKLLLQALFNQSETSN